MLGYLLAYAIRWEYKTISQMQCISVISIEARHLKSELGLQATISGFLPVRE